MAVTSYSRAHTKRFKVVLPPYMRDALSRVGYEIAGTSLVAVGLFLLFSLLSFNAGDPSLNTATSSPPSNWVGIPGALSADLLIQIYGLAAFAFVTPLLVWGGSLLWRGRWLPERRETWLRVGIWPLAAILLAASLAALPIPASWPLMTGLGGLVGETLMAGATTLPALGFITAQAYMALLSLALGVMALCYCLGIRRHRLGAAFDTMSLWLFLLRETWQVLKQRMGLQKSPDSSMAPLAARHGMWHRLFSRKQRDAEAADLARRIPPVVSRSPLSRFRLKGRKQWDEQQQSTDDFRQSEAANRIVRDAKKTKLGKREESEAQPTLELEPLEDYQLPPLSLLAKPKPRSTVSEISDEALEQNARMLESVLQDFGVRGEIIRVRPGPVVTLYELEPAAGVKSSRVIGLSDDIARSMSAVSARVAVIPGRNVIGIELPNLQREIVYLRELLSSSEYENASSKLTLALGKNIGGEPVMVDLASMPHLLIAGTTGSGKSVGINTMILSLLYRLPPSQCKLILIDPKMLELSVYEGIPHLIAPVVTDPKKAIVALKWVVREMQDRYKKMSKLGVRNIAGYNARVAEAIEQDEQLVRTVQTGFDSNTGQPIYEREELPREAMPLIVVVVDEMADLMMVAGKDIEAAVQRLAQMARAAGIHLITATQRPSVDVITGTIKANFPTRISFQVTSKIDSRTILGEQGAEQLLGQGDMLYMASGGRIRRIHGPLVTDDEVEKIVRFLKKQGRPAYLDAVLEEIDGDGADILPFNRSGAPEIDDLYREAIEIVVRDGRASTSYVQRRLQIGYNRAARIIERMEEEGVVSPPNHGGKREVLIGEHATQ